ncbi:hypothetical protein Sjap_003359 [Stephania japonica]|uniref:Uncharacterized protein n=1 Tax=Stephania japonica TaxID=461633 RepID=A0AAP0KR09_9MAGN
MWKDPWLKNDENMLLSSDCIEGMVDVTVNVTDELIWQMPRDMLNERDCTEIS